VAAVSSWPLAPGRRPLFRPDRSSTWAGHPLSARQDYVTLRSSSILNCDGEGTPALGGKSPKLIRSPLSELGISCEEAACLLQAVAIDRCFRAPRAGKSHPKLT
jgi:hypothetical protein